jgi:hypothetical protein
MAENQLTYAEKSDEVILIQMINCFDKSYGRYFEDSVDRWREIDKEKKEKDRLKMDREGIDREDTRLVPLNNLIEKEKDDIVGNLILRNHPIPPWKFTDKK